MIFNLIHPSRGRANKSRATYDAWNKAAKYPQGAIWICSLDEDDDIRAYLDAYTDEYGISFIEPVISKNKSAVDAINNAAKHWQAAEADISIVVSDDTEPCPHWDELILKEVEGRTDWILKTQDGIQDWIITMPVMDRAYYERTGYIYDPDFLHMFCDTWLTVQADISGRKITSNLKFPHLNGSIQDDLRKRCDATWDQGEKTFIQKVRNTPIEDLNKITDRGMKNWIRNKTGIRV